MHHTPLWPAIVALSLPAFAQSPLVAPNGYAAVEGGSNNSFPWNRAGASMHFQQIYDSTNFTLQGVAGPILVSRIRFRANSAATTTTWPGGNWPNVRIDLSTATVDFLAPSATFAANHGADRTTVLDGPVAVAGGAGNGVGVPGPWHVDLALDPSFVYDPTAGRDLVLDVALDGLGWTGAATTCDAVSGAAASPPALGTRIYNGSSANATGGTIGFHHVLTTAFTFVSAVGLHPAFTAAPRSGPPGQIVNFTDRTWTTDPGGVTSWAWDVDGDLVPDYTTRNCSHTYLTEGSPDVTLTVTSNLYGTRSTTRATYVVIGAVDASFTATILPGNLVTFTDTSTGNPTNWAWDFEDDGIVDATTRNASFVYPDRGAWTCRLRVADAFSSDATTATIGIGVLAVPAFGSTGAGDTGGFWFQAPIRFSIVSARVPDESGSGTQSFAIFRLLGPPPVPPGVATGGLAFFASNQPGNADIPCVLSFDAGEYVGVLAACGTTISLTSLATPAGPFAASVLGQPCTLTHFVTPYNLSTSGPSFLPYWSEPAGALGRVHLAVTACAGIAYGAGTPSGAAPPAPELTCTALPFVGRTAVLEVTQYDTSVLSFLLAGFGRAALPSPYGTILVGNLVATQMMNGAAVVGPGTYAFPFGVPNDPGLVGVAIAWQNANLLVTTNQVSLSNGNELWIDT